MADAKIVELMAVPEAGHDTAWLKKALQAAIELEFSTIPPYLQAWWSVVEQGGYVATSIFEVVLEEMLHMALACNLLAGIGGRPVLNEAGSVPQYPRQGLPGGVHTDLNVSLSRLSDDALDLFMAIERPENGPIFQSLGETFPTIGAFYTAVLAAFEQLSPHLDATKQLDLSQVRAGWPGPITDMAGVEAAIALIKHQGEGSDVSPEEAPNELAHYYRFAELRKRQKVGKNAQGEWGFFGDPIVLPEVLLSATIPLGGYKQADVPATVWALLSKFDQAFTTLLDQLQVAWDKADVSLLTAPVFGTMLELSGPAVALMGIKIGATNETYGPCFRLVRAALTGIKILPPLAIARFGSSPQPMDNYELDESDASVFGAGLRGIVGAETLVVDPASGEITGAVTPTEIKFRDANGIRPVCPFLELWGVFDDGKLRPLTTSHLEALGLSAADVKWRVRAGNHKAFRRTGAVADKIDADTGTVSDHTAHGLVGRSPNFKSGKGIPFGSVQYIKPNAAFPEIRLRITPAKGKVFGPATGDPNVVDDVYDAARGGWVGHQDGAMGTPLFTVPAGIFAGDAAGASLGYLDDACDGIASVEFTAGGKTFNAHARFTCGPPHFAPDSMPVRTVADEIEQMILGPERTDEVKPEEVVRILRSALDTVHRMNTDSMNRGGMAGHDTRAGRAAEPIFQPRSRADNALVRSFHAVRLNTLKGLSAPANSPERAAAVGTVQRMLSLLRSYDKVADLSDAGRRQMPALMRNADGFHLAVTTRQLNTVKKAADQFAPPPAAPSGPEADMRTLIANLNFASPLHAGIPVGDGRTLDKLFASHDELLNYLRTANVKGSLSVPLQGQKLVVPGDSAGSAFVKIISNPAHPMHGPYSTVQPGIGKTGIDIVKAWIDSLS